MKRSSPPRSISEKRKRSGVKTRWNSTIAILPSTADRLNGMPRHSTELVRKAKPRKRNPERQAKAGKRYQEGLRKYRASETWKLVEARCDGRCEFAVLAVAPTGNDSRYLVLDVRIDKVLPEGYVRCGRKRRSHHHRGYLRFGGNELPEDMLAGCGRCHEYVEAMKAAHRWRAHVGAAE